MRNTTADRARAGLDRAPTPHRAPYTRPRVVSPSEPSRGLQSDYNYARAGHRGTSPDFQSSV